MAIHANSTLAPAFRRCLLRGARAPCRIFTDDQVVAEVEAEFAALIAQPWPELPPEPLLSTAEARAIHSRRRLLQAFEQGFDVLDALGLSPAALDAVDTAIAALDEAEAAVEDLEDGGDNEPSLGAPENHPGRWHIDMDDTYYVGRARHPLGSQTAWPAGGVQDLEFEHDGREHEAGYDLACDEDELDDDPSDKEPSLGWPNDPQAVLSDDLNVFTDLEAVNEDGDDCGEAHAPWWDRIGYEIAEGIHA